MRGDRQHRGVISAFQKFMQQESAGGLILIAAAAAALTVANSALAPLYHGALDVKIGALTLHHWINDGLMALFFLVVGLEIKRELIEGELASWKRRTLPCLAALGGMIAPALIYAGLNASDATRLRGWAIPAATDIAFALGVLALLGSRAPASLKIFLSALAILDDLGAVAIIALFYTSALAPLSLVLAALTLAALIALNRFGVRRIWPYLGLGAALWAFTLQSGVHPTVAGVALAFAIPSAASQKLEHWLGPWTAFAIAPIFAFANAGVSLSGLGPAALLDTAPLGIALGLFLGKQIGVFGAAWSAIKLGWADAPAQTNWRHLYGVAVLCGIGFTMSLFIGFLAFPASPALQEEAKLGVLAGSLASALLGFALLRVNPRPS